MSGPYGYLFRVLPSLVGGRSRMDEGLGGFSPVCGMALWGGKPRAGEAGVMVLVRVSIILWLLLGGVLMCGLRVGFEC